MPVFDAPNRAVYVSLAWANGPYTVRLGVINLFDKQPPVLPQFTQFGNTGTAPFLVSPEKAFGCDGLNGTRSPRRLD